MRDVGSLATPIMATFPLKQRPPSEGTVISAAAPCRTFAISASGTPTRTLTGLSSTIEKTGIPAATVWPGSTLRIDTLPEIGARSRVSSKPLSFLARLGVCRMCLCSRRGAVFLARALLRHLVALFRGVVGRFDLLKVVRRQALSFHQELHALVFVLPAFEVDAGLFQFLFPETGVGLLRDGQCRLPSAPSPR